MMDDAVDDAMDVGVEEEGDEVVEQVLEEIGIDLNQAVRLQPHPVSDLMHGMADFWMTARGDAHHLGQLCSVRGQGCASRWGWRRQR